MFISVYIFIILLGIWMLSIVGCVALAILCYRLVVDRGRLLLRLDQIIAHPPGAHPGGMPVGAYLPDVALPLAGPEPPGQTGAMVAISDLIRSQTQPTLLMFLDSDSLYSRALARELTTGIPGSDHPGIIAVIGGDPPGSPDFPFFPGTLLVDVDRQAAPIYGVAFTPAGYLVAPTRHTLMPLFAGPAALLRAARGEVTADQPHPSLPVTPIPRDASRRLPPLGAADAAPDLHLTTATGEPWSLAAHRGHAVLLLFVDPDCPPCHGALAQVAACNGAGIAIVSSGMADDLLNAQAAAIPGATLLMQQQHEAAHAFRMLDTPAIYEVSTDGSISAGPIIGLQQITRYLTDGICRHTPSGASAA
ncbi:MAG: redoxin domain-containing protein [Thermomicrobiales bacterium]